MTDQPEALRLADWLERRGERQQHLDAARLLREQHAEIEELREANEAFGKRQEWWSEKMFQIETEVERLREAVTKYGRHLDGCVGMLGGYQCTCGFNQQGVKP